jgi:hypothetical protein
MSDQEDSLQIHTSNQIEVDRKLAKKKKFLEEKKTDKLKKVIRTQGSDGVIGKKFDKKVNTAQLCLKPIKIQKNLFYFHSKAVEKSAQKRQE